MKPAQRYGLSEKTLTGIIRVFYDYEALKRVILFGSRAKGNFREGSDIDLALVGKRLDMKTLRSLEIQLDDLMLPYHIDLLIYHKIKEPALKQHIDTNGIILFESNV